MVEQPKKEVTSVVKVLNRTISMAFLSFPSILILFLYVFAGNCRKVAFYRGYLLYLEDLFNNKYNSNRMECVFNNESLKMYGVASDASTIKEYIGESFFSMRFGPYVMAIFILIVIFVSFFLSYHFATKADNNLSFEIKKRGSKCLNGCKEKFLNWIRRSKCLNGRKEKFLNWIRRSKCLNGCKEKFLNWISSYVTLYKIVFCVLLFIVIVFSVFCFIDLISNDIATNIFHLKLDELAGI